MQRFNAVLRPLAMVARLNNGALNALRVAGLRAISSDASLRVGLVNEHATDEYFTNKLDFTKVDDLLMKREHLERAVEKDAKAANKEVDKYLNDAYHSVNAYTKDRDQLCDREVVKDAVASVLNTGEGKFGLFLGGKSTGKSFILDLLIRERRAPAGTEDSVLLIDARDTGVDLLAGLRRGIPSAQQRNVLNRAQQFLKGTAVAAAGVLGVDKGAEMMADAIWANPKLTPAQVIRAFVDEHNGHGRVPCIIIDEANLALASNTPELRQQTIEVLEQLVKLTKQLRLANVLLACSEHAEPYRLYRLGFNTLNFSPGSTIFSGEVPPKAMLDKLKELGVGDNLAHLLVGAYGGHLWTILYVLEALATRSDFRLMNAMPGDVVGRVTECLEAEGEGVTIDMRDYKQHFTKKDLQGMRGLLHQLAETGFAPLSRQRDPRGELLSLNNIAGTVTTTAVTVGIRPEQWAGKRYGLVPATQYTRLLIADALNGFDRKQK